MSSLDSLNMKILRRVIVLSLVSLSFVVFSSSSVAEASFKLVDYTTKNGVHNWEKWKEGNDYREVFRYPGNNSDYPNNQYWTAPTGIKNNDALVELWGAGGNGGHGHTQYKGSGPGGGGSGGGAGGYIFALDKVTPGDRYFMYIGQAGTEIMKNKVGYDSRNQTNEIDDPTRLQGASAGGSASVFKWDVGLPNCSSNPNTQCNHGKAVGDRIIGAGGGGPGLSLFANPYGTCIEEGGGLFSAFQASGWSCFPKSMAWPPYGSGGFIFVDSAGMAWGGSNSNLFVLSKTNVDIFNQASQILYDIFTKDNKPVPPGLVDWIVHVIGTGGWPGNYEVKSSGTSVTGGGGGGKGVVISRYPNSVNDYYSGDIYYYYLPQSASGEAGGGWCCGYDSTYATGNPGAGAPATVSPFNGYSFGAGGDGKMKEDEWGVGGNGGAVVSYTICSEADPDCNSFLPTNGFIDIGLRVNQGTVSVPDIQKIAIENPSSVTTSKLIIFKNGHTYHVALVDPGDADATKVRVVLQDGTSKALRKYTGSDPVVN